MPGPFPETARLEYLNITDKLRAGGAEGIILGCTEIPLLMSQADRPDFAMFDTTGLHIQAAVTMARPFG